MPMYAAASDRRGNLVTQESTEIYCVVCGDPITTGGYFRVVRGLPRYCCPKLACVLAQIKHDKQEQARPGPSETKGGSL